jgi:phosphohistidine phosphatase
VAVKELYLVRHGQAASERVEPQRPLTPEGRSQVERTGSILKSIKLQVDVIYHSGKTRAEETADGLASSLSPENGVRWRRGLNPNDPVEDVLEDLDQENDEKVMLVGHLPSLERLAAHLLAGSGKSRIIVISEATAVGLQRDGDNWIMKWILDPSVVGS